ncbi:hypothetical protein TAL182_PE00024 (plasmid) [Rhizobium sp. TAL182]|nr:hypothetical protein TAL182_PE00024 [Rhizobium sp. TAL182]
MPGSNSRYYKQMILLNFNQPTEAKPAFGFATAAQGYFGTVAGMATSRRRKRQIRPPDAPSRAISDPEFAAVFALALPGDRQKHSRNRLNDKPTDAFALSPPIAPTAMADNSHPRCPRQRLAPVGMGRLCHSERSTIAQRPYPGASPPSRSIHTPGCNAAKGEMGTASGDRRSERGADLLPTLPTATDGSDHHSLRAADAARRIAGFPGKFSGGQTG